MEQGETLSRDELSQLERAADLRPGPSLRLSLAHALINADAAGAALALLEGLRRDFPREVQVRLGLARALSSLERWAEAERALEEALALNPKDPEALVALAISAMRRGERARARKLVGEVLEVDPFDGEARLLREELDAEVESALEAPPKKESRRDFARALMERLKAQSTPALLQRDHLLVRLGRGGVGRLDLASLYAGYLAEARDLSEAVEAIARELAERALGPEGKDSILARAMPVLRDAGFLDRAVGAVRREGPAGLFVFYALFDSELVCYLPQAALEQARIELEELDLAAWRNLKEKPAALQPVRVEGGQLLLAEKPSGVWALAEGDGHDGARLLSPSQQRAIAEAAGPGPYRVSLAKRELSLICREEELDAVEALEAVPQAADGVEGRFRLFEGRLTAL